MSRIEAKWRNARAVRFRFSQSLASQHTAVAILNTDRMNYSDEQQASCVYENMSFFALDFLACVEPVRIDRDPPFSALFTL
jgi:hypothetical protein